MEEGQDGDAVGSVGSTAEDANSQEYWAHERGDMEYSEAKTGPVDSHLKQTVPDRQHQDAGNALNSERNTSCAHDCSGGRSSANNDRTTPGSAFGCDHGDKAAVSPPYHPLDSRSARQAGYSKGEPAEVVFSRCQNLHDESLHRSARRSSEEALSTRGVAHEAPSRRINMP